MNKSIVFGRNLCFFFLFLLPTYSFSCGEDTLVFKTSYENSPGRVIYKILKDENNLYAIGSYSQKFNISNQKLVLDKEINNHGTGRDGYVIGDNLYVVVRTNGNGNKYTLVPKVMLDFEENISNFEDSIGTFDHYFHEGSSFIDETDKPCPNLGLYSARLSSNEDQEALLEKKIETTTEAFVSLWVNFDQLSDSSHTKIPLMSDGVQEIVSLITYRKNDLVKIGINIKGEKEWIAESNMRIKEWYNLKIHINEKKVDLSYRSKECGDWLPLIEESHGLINVGICSLCIGICSPNKSLVYIDDYYYHPTDIDKVSYINGIFTIYDKNSLEAKSQMHLDIRPNSISVHDNHLFLCCLRGINVYDISDPDNPKLVGTHRRKQYKEFQGSDICQIDDKVYLIVSIYTNGTAVFDITIPEQISLIKDIPIRNNSEWEKCFTFDVVCQYPYAYSSMTVLGTDMFTNKDFRGILSLDLTNIKSIKQTLCQIPNEAKSEVMTADNQPNQITKFKDKLILNNSTKGILIFNLEDSGMPKYHYCQSVPGKSAIRAVSAFEDGSLFAGDTRSGDDNYPDYGIYWYVFTDKSSGISHLNDDDNKRNTKDKIWYTLSGQKLKGSPTSKGIYITGNMKVIIN